MKALVSFFFFWCNPQIKLMEFDGIHPIQLIGRAGILQGKSSKTKQKAESESSRIWEGCFLRHDKDQLGAKRLPSAKESRHCHGEQRSCLFQHTVTSDARGHMTGPLAVRLTAAFWDVGFLWSEVGNERSRNQNTDARLSSSDVLQWGGNL